MTGAHWPDGTPVTDEQVAAIELHQRPWIEAWLASAERAELIRAYQARERCPHCGKVGRLFSHHDWCNVWGVPLAELNGGGHERVR